MRIAAPNKQTDHSSFTTHHSHFARVAHAVHLTSALVRRLCAPVEIGPGERLADVGAKLGVTGKGLTHARVSGVFRHRHLVGMRGQARPLLFREGMLDPQRPFFVPADQMWGWMAQSLAYRIPEGLEQTIKRVPCFYDRNSYLVESPNDEIRNQNQIRNLNDEIRIPKDLRLPRPQADPAWYKWKEGEYLEHDWRNSRSAAGHWRHERRKERERRRKRNRPERIRGSGSMEFRGWRWICPQCNDAVRVIYYPIPLTALVGIGDCATRVSRFTSHPNPSTSRFSGSLPGEREHGFACHRCHRVMNYSAGSVLAWNAIVAYVSGGLLYGREVDRPVSVSGGGKRENRSAQAARDRRICELRERNWPLRRIAMETGESYWRVVYVARRCRLGSTARTRRARPDLSVTMKCLSSP